MNEIITDIIVGAVFITLVSIVAFGFLVLIYSDYWWIVGIPVIPFICCMVGAVVRHG